MHTEQKPSNPDVQYEKTDAHARPLYQFLFWISLITLLTAILSMGILRALESWREGASTRALMAEPQERQLPPAPRLQMREPMDLAAFRKEEEATLSTYGVVDREKGIYRIPIDEAMKLTLERGLPSRAEAESPEPASNEPAGTMKK
jgi:hypothetical protein